VPGVLCVTGDARGSGIRPDVTQVFDLDGMRLTSLAARFGLTVAAAESPGARPTMLRPTRLTDKQRAGASLGILNHVSSASVVREFVAAFRAAGGTLPLIASVAIFTDVRSAAVLQRFPGLRLDPEVVSGVLGSPNPAQAGIDAAVAEAGEMLAIDGVAGVNISGLASDVSLEVAAEVKAEVGRQLLARTRTGS
jgi:methylenetetrahydrofolate reductase (NADPH)